MTTSSNSTIEEMQARLIEVAKREQALIKALDQALAKADRELLDEVRSVTLEHEARRALILSELQSLATRVGAFPASAASAERITYIDSAPLSSREVVDVPSGQEQCGGDWRQAVERLKRA